ncbi:hypothetical protein CPB84DRAFT_1777374 [Gymnopilus junonius]|uniref:Uncharacterized protein n=1 Tax=Gymnopilus junonius TaxID=109634 RepID=A0A9P5NLJ9_GYMJU|nr:hypothetical protein CPB84DRAFT_1777374 [Gymnopilus junonius]
MADYYASRHPSQEPSYTGDDVDENAMRRSITRGSHQSHPSVSPSTRSWVQANQMNPPGPPPLDDDVTPSPSPSHRRSRPLPDPSTYRPQSAYQPYGPPDVVQEEQRMDVYAHPAVSPPLPFGFPTEELGDEAPVQLPSSPMPYSNHLRPPLRENRSFVGGFFSGLKRLPKMLKGGGGGKQRLLKRKGTFGTDTLTEGTSTATAITRGNTLPRYLSNPSIGPTNPQFAHRLSMAVNKGELLPSSTPTVFHLRQNQAGPQYPMVTITPASDGDRITEEQASFFEEPPDGSHNLFMGDNGEHGEHMVPDPQERTTVMVYNTDSQAPTIAPVPIGPMPPRQATPGPRVSYQAQLPTRANVQAQTEQHPTSTDPQLHAPTPVRPTPPILQSPKEVLSSTQATSSYTISAAPSFYDPSYATDLTPVEKFFKGLYNLPWVAHERITIDYRPADSKRAQDKIRGLKKPMASWYRSLIPRSRRTSRSLDLLSSGTPSSSTPTSLGNPLTPLASPISRRSGRSSNTNSRSRPKRHRKKRHTVSSSATGMSMGVPIPQRNGSPIIPTAYPYAYPGYPYAYPYSAYPTAMPFSTSPRGPRKHKSKRTMKYPHGYAPYQPMAIPPMGPMAPAGAPLYIISPSPPQSANGGGGNESQPQPQAHLQPQLLHAHPSMQMIMPYVPGAFNPNPSMVSPPLTPQRPEAFGS